MKCLVTGGAGFIGSHLVDRLVAEGHDVAVVDDLSAGRAEHINPAAMFCHYPISRVTRLDQDWIFHLAGIADIVPSIEQPWVYFDTNVAETLALLEAVRKSDGKVIFAASSSCYGTHAPIPTNESAPIAPAHPYAMTKRLAEELVLHYGEVYRIPVVSLRLFNVYGPRARTSGAYGAVMGTFFAQRANNVPLTIVGDGLQQRDFTYVSDVVDAFVRAAESPSTGIYNIGAGDPISIQNIARLIGGPAVHIPARGGEPDITWADPSKAKRDLGWEATVSIETGIARLLEDLDAWKSAPIWNPDTIATATETWHRYLG